MLDAVIVLLSFYGLTWIIRESEILSFPRNWIMRQSVFMFKLLSCSGCTGFHVGYVVYLLHNHFLNINIFDLILWSFASSATSFILSAVVNRLGISELN